jgi:hypothetical protein
VSPEPETIPSQQPEGWPIPQSARVDYNHLRKWGDILETFDAPPQTHRSSIGRIVLRLKSLGVRGLRPFLEPVLLNQSAWNSEVLRKIWELEQENRQLKQRLERLEGLREQD